MKRRLTIVASLALALAAPSIASAAHYRTGVEAPHRAPIGAWVQVQGQLYRNNKVAGFKHRFDHTYRWSAFALKDWKAFNARGRQGHPPPPKGQWQKPDSKLQMQNFWRTQSPGAYVLTVRTSKTGWVNAGTTQVTIGRARPKRVLKHIRLAQKHIKLQPGQQVAIGATGLDQHGRPFPGAPLQYRLHGGGRLHGHSFIAGHQPGTFKIEVLGPRGRICEALIIEIVEPRRLTTISLSQSHLKLDVGASAPISAQGFDQHGRPMAVALQLHATGGRYHNGRFYAGNTPGTYQLIASTHGSRVRAALSIEICEPPRLSFVSFQRSVIKVRAGRSLRLDLIGYDQFGNRCAIPSRHLNWSCRGGQLARGHFTAHKPGAYLVTVTDPSSGLSDQALIIVR